MPVGVYTRTNKWKKENPNFGWNGKHRSKKTKEKIRKKLKGKLHSEKRKENTKLAMIKMWENMPISKKQKHSFNVSEGLTGKKLSKEHIEASRKGNIGRKQSRKERKMRSKIAIKHNFVNNFYVNSRYKYSATFIELKMEKELNKCCALNIFNDYQKQVRLKKKYLVDFLVDKNLILECYGNYWHSGFAKKYKDMKRQEYLEKLGYKFLIFWEDEIKSRNFNLVKALKNRGINN